MEVASPRLHESPMVARIIEEAVNTIDDHSAFNEMSLFIGFLSTNARSLTLLFTYAPLCVQNKLLCFQNSLSK